MFVNPFINTLYIKLVLVQQLDEFKSADFSLFACPYFVY